MNLATVCVQAPGWFFRGLSFVPAVLSLSVSFPFPAPVPGKSHRPEGTQTWVVNVVGTDFRGLIQFLI